MKKLLTASVFCSVALFISACSDEKKELSQDAFKFDIETKRTKYETYKLLSLTAKDDIEIKRITTNSDACRVTDFVLADLDKRARVDYGVLSRETPAKVCYDNKFIFDCRDLVKWAELSKGDCGYKYKYDIDDKSEDYKLINERVEKTENKEYIESCERAKKVAKEKYDGKYYYDYKVPMKFDETKEFVIIGDKCSDVVEFSVYTNKGVVTYSVK
ncbi:hypothetical protein AVANS_1772 [Campylobacter sp. RM5004]|uniref:hypothetical protein n=1 Tax=Campylobacter sp. RM5004 TaxID=1660078 RepID=UPI001EFB9AA9|nr:hypothetical protein [Campylobacter sp. RM5004]ULO02377.1 hypothetical protein AVANS_1772 [Campylobacter sp. RM5004]